MLGLVLDLIFYAVAARAVWRLVRGIMDGLSGPPAEPGVPSHGVQMVRDPVCGTYVVPGRAVAITDGRRQIHFCSAACRDKYRAMTA